MRLAHRCVLAVGVLALLVLGGCASPRHKAPVEDRGAAPSAPAVAAAAVAGASAPAPMAGMPAPGRAAPTTDAAGRPLFHTVRPGDTLIRIGLENGQNWRDIARWNGIENPNLIEVGQTLRVAPPGIETTAMVRTVPLAGSAEARPLDGSAPDPAVASSAAAAASGPAALPGAAAGPGAPAAASARSQNDEDVPWMWPAAGPVLAGFDDVRSKGLAIGGKSGDPVVAAADGRVVYAGSGLRGYGNLVIVKHNATFLTAYAHNQSLLVKEDQVVRRGQKIAEMGSSDAERVQLHFEIRRQGKPIDPARLLPAR